MTQNQNATEHLLTRAGAVCAMLLALSIGVPGAVEAFTGETTPTSFILGLGVALGAPALTGLYLYQSGIAIGRRRFHSVAYLVNLLGLCLFAGAAYALNLVLFFLDEDVAEELMGGSTGIAVLASVALFVVGSVLFGISMLRARVFARTAALGYTVLFPLLALLAPLPDSVLISAVHVLAGAALFQLAATVWNATANRRREAGHALSGPPVRS
jgi:hypothetical protein